jgi:hypothetical protein
MADNGYKDGDFIGFEVLRNDEVLALATMHEDDEYVVEFVSVGTFDHHVYYKTFSVKEPVVTPHKGSPLEDKVEHIRRRAQSVEKMYRKWIMDEEKSIYKDFKFYDRWSMRRVPPPFVITGGDEDED